MLFNTPQEAWQTALNEIAQHGTNILTEDNKLTREILNLELTIKHPLQGHPLAGCGWKLPALEQYAQDLCNFSYELKGFDYNYCERMGRQVFYATNQLKRYPTSRRATIFLWLPEKDLETGLHNPCQIMADYKIRNNKLQAAHVFRSHDIRDAWPANVYGLAKLQEQIAKELDVGLGPLTTYSISAHYYIY